MAVRRVLISLGVGATAFLLSSVVGFQVFGADFPSVFYVLPLALVATVLAVGASVLFLGSQPGIVVWTSLVGVAGFGYSVFFLLLVRYAVPPTRALLDSALILLISAVVAVGLAALAWGSHPTPADG